MSDQPQAKLTLADVFHRLVDALGLHQDTAKNLHTLVDENVASSQELEEKARSPWAGKPDQEVIDAAIAGDPAAAAEYRARKDRQAAVQALGQPPAPEA